METFGLTVEEFVVVLLYLYDDHHHHRDDVRRKGEEFSILIFFSVVLFFSEPDFVHVPPSVIATACICSAVRGLRIASSDLALKSICALLKLSCPEDIEIVINRIEEVFQAEAAAFQQQLQQQQQQLQQQQLQQQQQQQSSLSSKGSGLQNLSTTTNAGVAAVKEEDTVDGHPETPTDIQDVHF